MPRGGGRVVIEGVRPAVDGGAFAAKGAVGLPLQVSAVLIIDGHDRVLGWVRHGPARKAAGTASSKLPSGWRELQMEPLGNDLHACSLVPPEAGPWSFEVVAVPDDYGTWLRDLRLRFDDGQDVGVELQEGALMAEHRATRADVSATDKRALTALAHALLRRREAARLVAAAEAESAVALMRRTVDRRAATLAGPFPLWIDRELGAFSAWYELFPRSEGATPHHPGTLKTAAARLPGVAAMGFDILYLPPIHPIGVSHRKGANNSLDPGPEDPGSPWAIGSAEGGHTAIHPDLGTIKDFDSLVAAARQAGIEVALD